VSSLSSGKPRVLHILPTLGLAGAENIAAYLLLGLASRFETGVVSLYARKDNKIERSLREAGIPLWHLDKRPGFDPRMFFRVDRALSAFRPDAVHTHLHVMYYTAPAVFRHRTPVWVHTVHNVAEREADRIGRALERIMFRRSVVPVAVGRQVALSLERLYGLRSVPVIRNGISVGLFRSDPGVRARWRRSEGFDEEALIVTCVGRLETQKNPLLLLRAFAGVNVPRSHLVFVGAGFLREQLLSESRALNIEARVHLLGQRGDIRECLAGSDVFALSSDWEGTPLCVMEAMAAGLPVVATSVGGVPELVQDGAQGILVPRGDRQALSDAISRLLSFEGLRASMGRSAQQRASLEFDQAQMVEGYAALYSALFREPGVDQRARLELAART